MTNPMMLEMPRGLIEPNDLLLPPEIRHPGLDQRLRETLPRRRLSHILISMRTRAGYTQREMAERLGINPSCISRTEAATTPWPKAQTIDRYARLCGLSLGYAFFDWRDEEDGSIFPLDPAAYGDKKVRADQNRLDALLPAELRREGFEEAWRKSLPRRRLTEQLVKLRAAKGLTQKELAARIDLDPAEVSRMESATQPWPKAERLQLYAAALDSNVGLVFLEPDGSERKGWIIPLAEPAPEQLADPAHARSSDVSLEVGGQEVIAPAQRGPASLRTSFNVSVALYFLRLFRLYGQRRARVRGFLPQLFEREQERENRPAAEL